MILESPHKDEFFGGGAAPANGNTGSNIKAWVADESLGFNTKDFGLILMNAIQYQCSLGCPTSYYRDDVFRDVWSNGGSNDFLERLDSVYHRGDVVVNCCTKGNGQPSLRRLVQTAITAPQSDFGVVEQRNHPSSWWSQQNRIGR